jgi:DNA polymerase III alpha subunit
MKTMYDISMIPLFKSNYSIGKSILTLDIPEDNPDETKADSILQIAKDNNLDKIVLVEDSMIGFLEAHKACKSLNIQLIFGLRINCCNDTSSEDKEKSSHKIIIFAKNDEGCKLLNKIYSKAYCDNNGFVDCNTLDEIWNNEKLSLAIPFYDSYIYQNSFSFNNCVPNFSFTIPTYFIENNNLPFEKILKEKVISITTNTILTKTIYYKNKKDVFAYQTYRCITNRSFGKEQSLSSPNLNHFGSDEFCWESLKEYNTSLQKLCKSY